MKKIVVILMSMVVNVSFAQISDFRFGIGTDNQELIKNAIDGGVFIVRSSYQLEDSLGHRFGSNNQSYFGQKITLGYKVNNGYIINDEIIHPYDYDKNYELYKPSYKPVNLEYDYRDFRDGLYTKIDSNNIVQKRALNGNEFYFVKDSCIFKGKGFEINKEVGDINGWVVWMVTDTINEDVFQKTGNVEYIIYRHKLMLKNGIVKYKISRPNVDKEIVGGVYIVPKITEIGQIQFELCGIVSKIENSWNIICPFVVNQYEMIEKKIENRLTPTSK